MARWALAAVRSSLLLLTALLVQLSVVSQLRVAGVQGDVMLLVGLAAGLAGGPLRGAIYGFAAGLVYDLVLTSPLGLSALAYAIAGFLVGVSREALLRAPWWFPVAAGAAGSALGVILYAGFGWLLGQPVTGLPLVRIVGVVSLINAMLSPLAVLALGWAAGAGAPRRAGATLP